MPRLLSAHFFRRSSPPTVKSFQKIRGIGAFHRPSHCALICGSLVVCLVFGTAKIHSLSSLALLPLALLCPRLQLPAAKPCGIASRGTLRKFRSFLAIFTRSSGGQPHPAATSRQLQPPGTFPLPSDVVRLSVQLGKLPRLVRQRRLQLLHARRLGFASCPNFEYPAHPWFLTKGSSPSAQEAGPLPSPGTHQLCDRRRGGCRVGPPRATSALRSSC